LKEMHDQRFLHLSVKEDDGRVIGLVDVMDLCGMCDGLCFRCLIIRNLSGHFYLTFVLCFLVNHYCDIIVLRLLLLVLLLHCY